MPARRAGALTALLTLFTLVLGGMLAPSATAHEERPASFPDGTGHVPKFLGLDNPRHRVVCKAGSAKRIARMDAGALKRRNRQLLRECHFHSIQTAINSIRHRRTSIYVLPGIYTERKWADQKRSHYCSNLSTQSNDPVAASEYIGSITSPDTESRAEQRSNPIALSYSDQRRCAHNLNLIAIFGDSTPKNKSIACDSKFCGTQIVGTGPRKRSVTIDNKFSKLNGIRADRMDGVYLSNFTVQQAEFNSLYVLETDGFVVDRVIARANDEYGILAFATDHGLIQHTDTYFNGDSGIYPGSASDLNGDNPNFKPVRYAIEIKHNRSHDNTLGYSGTAGNSVHAHDNRFYDNATGIATDSLFPGHPGLPQDHARWNQNKVYSNNSNYYTKYVDTGICAKPMAERGYMQGTVCPVVPVPVGTGLLIAGGNFDSADHNHFYDNWRYGAMQIWVPASLRDDYDPSHQYDTSNNNHFVGNTMGLRPNGSKAHNGMDFWWDDEGGGNCWEHNTSSRGEATNNFSAPVPSCAAGGSVFTPGAFVKDSGFLSCAEYDRGDPNFNHPPECNWFDSPPKPTDDSGDPFPPSQAATAVSPSGSQVSGVGVLGLLGLGVIVVGLGFRQRRA